MRASGRVPRRVLARHASAEQERDAASAQQPAPQQVVATARERLDSCLISGDSVVSCYPKKDFSVIVGFAQQIGF